MISGRERLSGGVLICWVLIGCGSPVVDPGRAPRPMVPIQVQPTPNEGSPSWNSAEIPQVPVDSVMTLPQEATSATYHSVQSGETLASVAKKYGVSADKLRSANGLDGSSVLKAKQLLFIPRGT